MSRCLAGTDCFPLSPPMGCDLSGFVARQQPSLGTHDPVTGSTLVLSDGHSKAALVSLDVVALEPAYSELLRARLRRELGLQMSLILATHTHSGPASLRLLACGEPDLGWLVALQEKVVASVERAASSLQEVHLLHGCGSTTIGFDRRAGAAARMRQPAAVDETGSTDAAPSAGCPPASSAGPQGQAPQPAEDSVDRALPVAQLLSSEASALCTLFQASCHPVSLGHDNRLVSADYPGFARRDLARGGGRWGLPVFLQGCCGDVNPAVETRCFAESERVGAELAAAVRATPLRPSAEGLTIGSAQRHLSLAYRSSPARVEVVVSALSLGDVGFVTLPGEAFSELGRRTRRASPFPTTFVCGYGNGCIGYLPTESAYEEGGYEVEDAHHYYGYPDCVAPGTAGLLVETAVSLLRECRSSAPGSRAT